MTDRRELLTIAEMAEADRRAVAHGVPYLTLMENAGRAVAETAARLLPPGGEVRVVCGPGNNGGDGFVVARHLDNHGWPVKVWLIRPETEQRQFGFARAAAATDRRLAPDCEVNAAIWSHAQSLAANDQPGNAWKESLVADVTAAGWVVDALFGTGLSRPLVDPFHELFPFLNECSKPILAVDLPSGLDCDTGVPLGPTVKATHTATFVAHKKGFLNPESHPWTGEVHVIDIGAPRALVGDYRQRRRS